jgi:hypothetical protein
MLRDFPHCFHQLFRIKICVVVRRASGHWRQVGAPGARGESRQVGSDKTVDRQEQNRCVMVRGLLQNEGIAGA